MLSELIQRYSQPFDYSIPDCRIEVEQACQFLQQHYAQTIGLEQVCQVVGLSKSTLLRAFTKSKGVTPYRYLQAIRVGAAQNCCSKVGRSLMRRYIPDFLTRAISPIIFNR